MSHRVVYMGAPAFAGPALAALAALPDVSVLLVVTQPDRPAGRGRQLTSPPVRILAERLGLPVYQVASLRTEAARRPIVEARPDLIVVAAFGLILGQSILTLPSQGCVNLHASLLPKYRGASPVTAAIVSGERESGVTLMRMERGLDTGPMLGVQREPILPDDTTLTLTSRLAQVAAELLVRRLSAILAGTAPETPQPTGASLTRPLVKADGWIDWRRPAAVIERQVRAMWSWPRAWTTLPDGGTLQIHQASVIDLAPGVPAGTAHRSADVLAVACGTGAIQVVTGQLAGSKALDGRQLATHRVFDGSPLLGQGESPAVPGPIVTPVDEA